MSKPFQVKPGNRVAYSAAFLRSIGYQTGELQRTSAGVPRRDAKVIKQQLEQIAQTSDEPIRPSRNLDGLVIIRSFAWTNKASSW